MEFTKENWENAPEGARLEWRNFGVEPVRLVGYTSNGIPVVETARGSINTANMKQLCILPPKRKVTVQLWRTDAGKFVAFTHNRQNMKPWTLIGEHTFEVEGE